MIFINDFKTLPFTTIYDFDATKKNKKSIRCIKHSHNRMLRKTVTIKNI